MITNTKFWNDLRDLNPPFAAIAPEASADFWNERNVTALLNNQPVMNMFWELTMPFYDQQIMGPRARNPLMESGFGDAYDIPFGDVIRRIAIDPMKGVSPKYRNLRNGDSVDMQVVRKPVARERYFQTNWDWANIITIPDMWEQKRILMTEDGIDRFVSACMQSLNAAFIVMEYEKTLEAIGKSLSSNTVPFKDSQIVNIGDMSMDGLTMGQRQEKYTAFIADVRKIVTAMTVGSTAGGKFNSLGYVDIQDRDRLYLLVRAGIVDDLAIINMINAAPLDRYGLDVKIIEVPHFGEITPYTSVNEQGKYEGLLYPVYDNLGTVIGYNHVEGSKKVTVEENDVVWQDPHADVYALLADKSWLFTTKENDRVIAPAPHNVRGLYTTFHDTMPNNGIHTDGLYNCVQFKTSSAA